MGGAGGSGGGLLLAAASITGLTAASVDLSGGAGGHERNGYYSGDGGEGRLRVDGATPPSLAASPTGASPTTWEGPAFIDITDTTVTIASSGTVTLYVLDDTGVMGPAGIATVWFEPDEDGDGYTDASFGGTDCDDSDAGVNPAATELCNGVDDDCDGATDEPDAADAATWYADTDGDGYGDIMSATAACAQPSGYVADASDCDDADAAVNPAAVEVWYDGVDQDCDGNDDDQDEDGWPVGEDCDDTDPDSYPGGPGLDDDCNPIDTGSPDTGPEDSGLGGGDLKGGGGCDCASGGAPVGALWLLGLGIAVLGRRRW